MDRPDDIAYYRARADEARRRAEHSEQPEVRRIHLEMAERYAWRAASAETSGERPPSLGNAL